MKSRVHRKKRTEPQSLYTNLSTTFSFEASEDHHRSLHSQSSYKLPKQLQLCKTYARLSTRTQLLRQLDAKTRTFWEGVRQKTELANLRYFRLCIDLLAHRKTKLLCELEQKQAQAVSLSQARARAEETRQSLKQSHANLLQLRQFTSQLRKAIETHVLAQQEEETARGEAEVLFAEVSSLIQTTANVLAEKAATKQELRMQLRTIQKDQALRQTACAEHRQQLNWRKNEVAAVEQALDTKLADLDCGLAESQARIAAMQARLDQAD